MPCSHTIRIATRRSPLALWQANYVKKQLERIHSEINVILIPLTTQGDQLLSTPLNKIGGKGLFIKELEHSLMKDQADIAVHSMKDVPMILPSTLSISAICSRNDPRDALVTFSPGKTLASLPKYSRIGTSSLRRKCQILFKRPDLHISVLRGNINTRLKKLDNNDYDAIILAAAGLIRLNIPQNKWCFLPPDDILPAAGQGAIGIEIRSADLKIKQIIAPLNDKKTCITINCERNMNFHLGGNCQVPIGGYAELKKNMICLKGLVGTPDGSKILKAKSTCSQQHHLKLGAEVAEALLLQGADKILRSLTQ